MEIESQLSQTNENFGQIYENIGEYADSDRQLHSLSVVNKEDLKTGRQQFDNNFHSFDNSELCVSPQEDDECVVSVAGTAHTRDRFCWVCHKDKSNINCIQCPRSYHLKCIPSSSSSTNSANNDNKSKSNNNSFDSWICVECKDILRDEEDLQQTSEEENSNNSSQSSYVGPKWRLAQMSAEELSELLKFALQTIRQSADPTFHKPVSPIVFPDYHQLVHYPMDLSTIEKNIKNNKYRSQTSFLADIKWIVHNCIIYNHSNHPLTTNAKYLSRVAKNEMAEMEICPDCFKNFYTVTDTSFAEPCRRPHQLVFARVKGYPLWPAKVVRLGGKLNEVDCRFFGTHDRAWVAVDACWLISEIHPGSKPNKTHKSKFDGAMRELAVHIERLNTKFADKFKYSPQKTCFSPKQIFILDEDNDFYNKLMTEMQSTEEKSLKNDSNDKSNAINSNNSEDKSNDKINETIEECVSNTSKSVIPGVFSLSSDNVLDEFKSDLNLSSESTNLLNKNKSNSQIKEDLSVKTRTARVGKRNVAEALRASKVQRTCSNSSSTSLLATQRSPSAAIVSNNSNTLSVTKIKSQTLALSQERTSLDNNLREELERMRKQINFNNAMHKEEIREVQHNSDLVLKEMRESWVLERNKALEDERQKYELERKLMIAQFENERKKLSTTIEETKRKQWCAECLKEAQLFCCYDTWYCTYECQKTHWKSHVNVCQQIHKKS